VADLANIHVGAVADSFYDPAAAVGLESRCDPFRRRSVLKQPFPPARMLNVDVLVTGATGLVGNNVVRELLSRGHRVRVVVRRRGPDPALASLPVVVHQGDLLDARLIETAAQGVEAIIHCAAHVHIGWSQAQTHHHVNVEGTRLIAEIARRESAKLIAISSVNALGISRNNQPADESTAVWEIVRCPYAESKRRADDWLREQIERGLRATIVHPTLMFGPWDWKPSSGKMILEVTQSLPIVAPAGGINVADARDVSQAIVTALERDTEHDEYILGGHNLTYLELWRKIAALVQSSRPWMALRPIMAIMVGHGSDALSRWRSQELSTNSAAMRMANQRHWFSSARAMRDLNYRPRPLDETLRDAFEFLSQQAKIRRAG
jgi:dihydroflavonol-4-reductase